VKSSYISFISNKENNLNTIHFLNNYSLHNPSF